MNEGHRRSSGSDMSGAGGAHKVLSPNVDVLLDEPVLLCEAHGLQDVGVAGRGGEVSLFQSKEQPP